MRVVLSCSRARWAFLSFVVVWSFGFSYLATKVWIADAWGASQTPERWQAAARLEPEDALYMGRVGLFNEWDLEHRDLAQAVKYLRVAVQIDPWSARLHEELASAYEMQEDYVEAQEEYESAEADYPKSGDLAWRYGNFLLRRSNLTDGFKQIQSALQFDPSLTPSAISECWEADHDVGKIMEEALPETSSAYLTALNYFVVQGQPDAALIAWEKLLKLKQTFSMAQAILFVNELIAENHLREATNVWNEALVATNWPHDAATDQSVVFNGGFEHDILNGGFDWRELQQSGISYSFDNSVAYSGKRSLRIEFDGSENLNFQHVFEYVPVQPNKHYRITALLRTENISSDSGIRFEVVEPGNHATLPILTPDVNGTAPWTGLRADVNTGAKTDLLEIVLRRIPSEKLDDKLRGTVWVDDVALSPSSKKPEGEPR